MNTFMGKNDTMDPVLKVRAFLEAAGLKFEIIHSEKSIFTVEDAAETIGVSHGEILKSILLRLDRNAWGLALMSGDNLLDAKKTREHFGARKVTFASPEAITEYCGFRPGGVSPVGYDTPMQTLMDQDLFKYKAVWCAAGSDHDFFPISPQKLELITHAFACDIRKD